MAGSPPDVSRASSTLRLGDRVLVRCDDGLLSNEYVLFESADIVLHATDPVTVREAGYVTSASEALARLARVGVTPALAEEAARAIRPEVVVSFARSSAVDSVASQLGACELFDGSVYRSATKTYEGAWLDLRGLAAALHRPGAPAVLQALHLAAALSEASRDARLQLSTASATRDLRPGERTYRRVVIEDADQIPAALRELASNARRADLDARRDRIVRDALLARLRERVAAETGPAVRVHLSRLEHALSGAEAPPVGPLSDPELSAVEQQLAAGDVTGISERLGELERARGDSAALRYLKARAALVRRDEHVGVTSAATLELTGRIPSDVAADAPEEAVRDTVRGTVFDFQHVESVRPDSHSALNSPQGADKKGPSMISAAGPTVGSAIPLAVEQSFATPVPAMPLPATPLRAIDSAAGLPDLGGVGLVPEVGLSGAAPDQGSEVLHRGGSLPPLVTVPPPEAAVRVRSSELAPPLRARHEAEIVESLALPPGAAEDVLAIGDWPTTPIQARTAMTRLARSLARDYRLWYGTTLRTNVLAVDAMQRHLAQRFDGASLGDPKVVAELQRHGALLSEILARSLGAEWVDIATTEPGYWAMFVPPSTRCWPIGRVYRFMVLGRRERDLVSYFLDLDARRRG